MPARPIELVRVERLEEGLELRVDPVAATVVRDEGASVAELADRLGYRSQAAFSRAFKRVVGVPPGAIKRRPDDPIASRLRE